MFACVWICADLCGYVRFLAEKGSRTNAACGVRNSECGTTQALISHEWQL
jgi:hypothetical protein